MKNIYKNIIVVIIVLSCMGSNLIAEGRMFEVVDKEIEVSGTVSDESGDALPGVTVILEGTTQGTVTDLNGHFQLLLPSEHEGRLKFSYVGYITKLIEIKDEASFNISMNQDMEILETITVIGYGQTQNRHEVTSSISTISPKKFIENRPIARLEQVLQGSTPAITVAQESGSPGASLTIRMRGVGTAGNASPLFILNGAQVPDLNFINPADIGNISAFKDAAAGAIYGSRAGNGVVNFQLKEASTNKKLNVNYSSYYGIQSLASEGEYLNRDEYVEYYNNSYKYAIRNGLPTGGRTPFTDDEIQNLPNTSWIKAVSDNASIQDHHLSFSGELNKVRYYLSGGILDQDGIIGKTNFKRKTLNVNVNSDITSFIELGIIGNYANNRRAFVPENSENSSVMHWVSSLAPIYPVYAESGSPYSPGKRAADQSFNGVVLNSQPGFGNPVLGFTHGDSRENSDILFGSSSLKIKLSKGLKLNSTYSHYNRQTDQRFFSPTFAYPDQDINNPINSLSEQTVEQTFWQGESYLNYEAKVGNSHSFSAIAGFSILNNEQKITGRNGRNFASNTIEEVDFSNIISDSTLVINDPYEEKNTTVSYYGRINYDFKQKYLFGAILRVDGSSLLAPKNRWVAFPSVSAGWVLSEENFLKESETISLLKIRASWGINGIDRIAPYAYIDRFQKAGEVFVSLDSNPDIAWEKVTQTNIGWELDLFRSKIGVTYDYYIKTTSDMLLQFPNPLYRGLPDPFRNAATVRNKGHEVMITYRDELFEGFKLNVSMSAGFNKNELQDLNGGLPIPGANSRIFNGAPDLSLSDVGHPIASFYGFKFDGLDDTGNPMYQDLSGPEGVPDGEISAEYDRTFIGNPYPDMIYGLNLGVDYKGIDFSVFISGVEGNDVVNGSTGFQFQYSNRTRRVLDAWTEENPTSQVIRPSALEVVNHEFSDYYIEDGSYARLKNITLGYSLPTSLIEKIKLEKMRFYISGNNLFTITDYTGYDPEIGSNNNPRDVGVDRGFYPQAKSLIMGMQLTF